MNIPFLDIGAAYEELREELDAAYSKVMKSGWFKQSRGVDVFEEQVVKFLTKSTDFVGAYT